MKKRLFCVVVLVLSLSAAARVSAAVNDTIDEYSGPVYVVVEQMPEFPGGNEALNQYIANNLLYPTIAKENGIQGRVICQFIVERDGAISDVVVVRSSGEVSLDKEAVRLIKSMPRWRPGRTQGKMVRVKYTVPINFRIK